MPDLTAWIEAQLKRGYTKEQVKRMLASRGYPAAAITMVDKLKMPARNNGNVIKKLPYMALALAAIAGIGILLLWAADAMKLKQSSQLAAQPEEAAPSQAGRTVPAGFSSMLSEAQGLCSQYSSVERPVKCEEALAKALFDSPGTVQKVSLGEELAPDSAGNRVMKEMWLFEIKLQKPAVFSGKEATSIIVGIGTSKDTGIKRRPLQ